MALVVLVALLVVANFTLCEILEGRAKEWFCMPPPSSRSRSLRKASRWKHDDEVCKTRLQLGRHRGDLTLLYMWASGAPLVQQRALYQS
jgi:hypothetical protein